MVLRQVNYRIMVANDSPELPGHPQVRFSWIGPGGQLVEETPIPVVLRDEAGRDEILSRACGELESRLNGRGVEFEDIQYIEIFI